MNKEIIELIRFVLEQANQQPVRRRITLYRGLSEICGDEVESKKLSELAKELNSADQRCAEFIFSFSQSNPVHLQPTVQPAANPPSPIRNS